MISADVQKECGRMMLVAVDPIKGLVDAFCGANYMTEVNERRSTLECKPGFGSVSPSLIRPEERVAALAQTGKQL